jgi:hypothetical protein
MGDGQILRLIGAATQERKSGRGWPVQFYEQQGDTDSGLQFDIPPKPRRCQTGG